MKKKSTSQSGFFNLPVLIGLAVVLAGICLPLFAASVGERSHRREVNPTTGGGLSFGPAEGNPAIPSGGSWTFTGSLNTARGLHTATLLPNGMVLVAGGQDDSFSPTSSAELYDPASGSWTATASLN